MRCLPKWALRGLSALLAELDDGEGEHHDVARGLRVEVDRCLKPSRAVKAARKPRAAKHRARRMETSALRAAVFARAARWAGRPICEAGACGMPALEMDHFWSGSSRRVDESIDTCWALCRQCHDEKGLSRPSAAAWLQAFITHCRKHRYSTSRAEARLARIVAGLAGGAA